MKSCEHVLPKACHMTILSNLVNEKFAKLDCVFTDTDGRNVRMISFCNNIVSNLAK